MINNHQIIPQDSRMAMAADSCCID